MLTNEIVRIHRSRIFELSFGDKDVLEDEAERLIRKVQLERAERMGNRRQAVKIYFQTSDGIIGETEATVWALTDEKVELKGEKIIPVAAVMGVET